MMVVAKPRRRYRFTLRTVFIGVTLFCIWLGLCSIFGEAMIAVTAYLVLLLGWGSILTDCGRHEKKLFWPMVILLGGIPGMLAYLLYRRPRRLAEAARKLANDCPPVSD